MLCLPRLKIILQSKKFIIISLAFLALYVLLFTQIITYASKLDQDLTELTGRVISYTLDGNKLSMIIKSTEKVKVTYYIDTLEEKEYLEEELMIGQEVYLKGTLSAAYNNTVPNNFNYQRYLYNNHIYVTYQADSISLLDEASFLNKIKNAFMRRINKLDNKAYLYAFILGETTYIDDDTYTSYQLNGTTHLFAVSGMHISILVLLLGKVLRKLKVKEGISYILIALFLGFYMFLIGFTPSVVRASFLYLFMQINRLLNLQLKTINILYLIFFGLLIIDPFYIYNLGFIYSFLTSFGLILFKDYITGNYLMRMLKVSAIAFLFSFPVTIYNFYEVNLLTIINNLIIVPFVSIVLFPFTLITFLLPFLDSILSILVNILEFISNILNGLALNLVVAKVNILFFVIYYLLIYLGYVKRLKYLGFIIILVFIYKMLPYLDSSAYVYYLDVGQGDCTVIIGENRSYSLMIDTGGKINYTTEEWAKSSSYQLSSNTLTFLKSLGVTKLDALIISHGDYDHMGEALNIVSKFPVKQVIFNQGEVNDLEQSLITVLNQKRIPYTQDIETLKFSNTTLQFLTTTLTTDENTNSLIIYMYLAGYTFLFMGDADINNEEEIIRNYNITNIDILKVGHHGSRTSTSTTFIETIKPKYAIISAGRNNRYGHPHAEVLTTLASTTVLRTDLQGSIAFKIKNAQMQIEQYPP